MPGLETAHSPNADDITTIYWVMLVVAGAFAVAINAALVYCIMRFRSERGARPARTRGRGRAQARAAVALAGVAVVLFVAGVAYTEEASEVEASAAPETAQLDLSIPDQAEPLQIRAVGQQWIWRYEYPASSSETGGQQDAEAGESVAASSGQTFADTFSYYELVVPVNRTVVVEVDSTDVVHRWWVPELGGKFDATPGRVNKTWFRADEEGTYEGQSAAFSGTSYATMRTRVRVVSQAEYEAWLSKQATGIQAAQASVQQKIGAVPAAADEAAADESTEESNAEGSP